MKLNSLGSTLLACVVVMVLFAAGTARLTRGFEHWTFESRRGDKAGAGELIAPRTDVVSASGSRATLFGGENAGRVYLVNFIYTACPTVCRVAGTEYAHMQEVLAAESNSRIHLVSLSFDVLHDSPQRLSAYARAHRSDPSHWTVAVPATSGAGQRLLRALEVVVVLDGQGGYTHNGDIHLVDGQGVLRGIYSNAQWSAALADARRLKQGT